MLQAPVQGKKQLPHSIFQIRLFLLENKLSQTGKLHTYNVWSFSCIS